MLEKKTVQEATDMHGIKRPNSSHAESPYSCEVLTLGYRNSFTVVNRYCADSSSILSTLQAR